MRGSGGGANNADGGMGVITGKCFWMTEETAAQVEKNTMCRGIMMGHCVIGSSLLRNCAHNGRPERLTTDENKRSPNEGVMERNGVKRNNEGGEELRGIDIPRTLFQRHLEFIHRV